MKSELGGQILVVRPRLVKHDPESARLAPELGEPKASPGQHYPGTRPPEDPRLPSPHLSLFL
jgi:hypothetical protein